MAIALFSALRRAGLPVLVAGAIALSGARQAEAQLSSQLAQMAPQLSQLFGTDQRTCDRGALAGILSTSPNNLIGSALGGAGGGLLGSKLGGGSGNTLLTVAGVLAGALAGGTIDRTMAPADQGCIGRTLENTPNRQTNAWQNPDRNASYWVTPTKTYQRNGTSCRNFITQALIDGRKQRVSGTACRQPDGSWKSLG
jgi:surface antigen